MYEIFLIGVGKFSIGNRAPDRKNSGKITKFIIKLKPWISFIFEANIKPSPMNETEIKTINKIAKGKLENDEIRNPIASEISRIKIP